MAIVVSCIALGLIATTVVVGRVTSDHARKIRASGTPTAATVVVSSSRKYQDSIVVRYRADRARTARLNVDDAGEYPVGRVVDGYYDPDDPAQLALPSEANRSTTAGWVFVFLVVLAFTFTVVSPWQWRQWRRASRLTSRGTMREQAFEWAGPSTKRYKTLILLDATTDTPASGRLRTVPLPTPPRGTSAGDSERAMFLWDGDEPAFLVRGKDLLNLGRPSRADQRTDPGHAAEHEGA